MQIKKTRLKQIIAEEIARFDSLSEEEKINESVSEKKEESEDIVEILKAIIKEKL
jgi:hypothetical protein